MSSTTHAKDGFVRASRCSETVATDSSLDHRVEQPIDLRPKTPKSVGPYVLQELLGRGGMGEVYVARHIETGEEVAIKLLRPELLASADALARFSREAKLTSRLRGKHAVRVIEVGGESGDTVPFLAMERLEGIDLAQILDLRGPLEVAEMVHWMVQACEAMVEAHELGVIHRDLKPSNLFVAVTPEGPIVKVLDFGISRLREGDCRLTATHNTVGTPIYMSPEQARNCRTVDARSDVWSLGVIAYELLTGQVPFVGDSPTEVAINVCTLPPAPLSRWRSDLPEGVELAIMRAIAKDPKDRFASAQDFAEALRPFSSGPRCSVPSAPSVPLVWLAPPPAETTSVRPVSQRRGPRALVFAFGLALGATTLGAVLLGAATPSRGAASESSAASPSITAAAPLLADTVEPMAAPPRPSSPPAPRDRVTAAATTTVVAAAPTASTRPSLTATVSAVAVESNPTRSGRRKPRFDERR